MPVDSFRREETAGRGKAVTLFVLTTVGSGLKIIITLIWLFVYYLLQSSWRNSHVNYDKVSWAALAAVAMIIFAILNFVGSLLMLRRILMGLWIYLVSQVVNLTVFVYVLLSLTEKITTPQLMFILIICGLSVLFGILYYSNRAYYAGNSVNRDQFIDDELIAPPGKNDEDRFIIR